MNQAGRPGQSRTPGISTGHQPKGDWPEASWLEKPAGVRTVLAILLVLTLGVGGSLALSIAMAPGSAWILPLWSGILFWGCSIATLILGIARPVYAPAPALGLMGIGFLSLFGAFREAAFWPGQMVLQPLWPAIGAMMLAWLGAMAWSLRLWIPGLWRTRSQWWWRNRPPVGGWRRGLRYLLHGIAIAFLLWQGVAFVWGMMLNPVWLMPGPPSGQRATITDKSYYRRGRGGGGGFLIGFDSGGRHYGRPLDHFYKMEVDVLPDDDPARDAAMQGCWNQAYARGDRLTFAGRDTALGFAVDRVTDVRRNGTILCPAEPRPRVRPHRY